MRKQPVIESVGSNRWPRYRIVDGDRYWAGNKWSQKERDARLFVNRNEADQVCNLLPSTRRFRTFITVTVVTAEDFSHDNLREFFEEFVSIVYENNACRIEVEVDLESLIEIT